MRKMEGTLKHKTRQFLLCYSAMLYSQCQDETRVVCLQEIRQYIQYSFRVFWLGNIQDTFTVYTYSTSFSGIVCSRPLLKDCRSVAVTTHSGSLFQTSMHRLEKERLRTSV